MKNNEKINLIKGCFTHEDGKEILMNLMATKINFHEIKNLSSLEQFGEENKDSVKRITELNKSIKKLEKIFQTSELKRKKLTIVSQIDISFSDDK